MERHASLHSYVTCFFVCVQKCNKISKLDLQIEHCKSIDMPWRDLITIGNIVKKQYIGDGTWYETVPWDANAIFHPDDSWLISVLIY